MRLPARLLSELNFDCVFHVGVILGLWRSPLLRSKNKYRGHIEVNPIYVVSWLLSLVAGRSQKSIREASAVKIVAPSDFPGKRRAY